MSPPTLAWIAAALLYAAFLYWYLPCGRRLSTAEREALSLRMRAGPHDTAQVESIERFLAEDRGDSFVMLNLLALAEPRATARRAMRGYERRFIGRLLRYAGYPLFLGRTTGSGDIERWGVDTARWDAVALVRYRCRRDLARMIAFSLEGDTRELKHQALVRTVAFPLSPWHVAGGPCVVVGLALALFAAVLQACLA